MTILKTWWDYTERRLPKTAVRSVGTILILISGVFEASAQRPPALPPDVEQITIDRNGAGTAFPHYWEQMFGSGRAILSLRDGYRRDLRTVKEATDFRYVRFHAIFHDETGFFDVDAKGDQHYNFSYIDQIYDGLLENGVRPFVELGFMPQKLASDPAAIHAFWYKQNVSPPKDYAVWDRMIRAFASHLIERYGIAEVSQWYFEVWNEPNIDFWSGVPKQKTYFELYDHTARAIKAADGRLRVGGPSTARASWVMAFLAHCKDAEVPVDFVSTHAYGDDQAGDVLGTDEVVAPKDLVCRAARKVHEEIASSAYPMLPFIMSEFNASWSNQPNVTDTIYMGPWLANLVRECDGLVAMTSYWTFSDVFEEGGVVKTPFYGGFGLIAEDGIPKPALNAFSLLHKLGMVRLTSTSDSALVTRHEDGSLAIALWNYAEPEGKGSGYSPPSRGRTTRAFNLHFRNRSSAAKVIVWRVDQQHGNALREYDGMGRPSFPSREQIEALRVAGKLAAPEMQIIKHGMFSVQVPPFGLVLLEIPAPERVRRQGWVGYRKKEHSRFSN